MKISQNIKIMKKILSIITLLTVFSYSGYSSTADYLMDPMPGNKPAPEFNLVGMDEKMHTLKSLEGRF